MGTKKRRVAAYLLDEVAKSFDDFKQRYEIEGDSQALNQILMQFFGLSEDLPHSSDVLIRLFEVEKTLDSLRGVRDSFPKDAISSSSDQLGLPLTEVTGTPVSEKEVAKKLNLSEKRLRSARKDKTEEQYNVWLAAMSIDFGVKYVYSMSDDSFSLCD